MNSSIPASMKGPDELSRRAQYFYPILEPVKAYYPSDSLVKAAWMSLSNALNYGVDRYASIFLNDLSLSKKELKYLMVIYYKESPGDRP
jgi:hypothetical protein